MIIILSCFFFFFSYDRKWAPQPSIRFVLLLGHFGRFVLLISVSFVSSENVAKEMEIKVLKFEHWSTMKWAWYKYMAQLKIFILMWSTSRQWPKTKINREKMQGSPRENRDNQRERERERGDGLTQKWPSSVSGARGGGYARERRRGFWRG